MISSDVTKWIIREKSPKNSEYNAGSKARKDVEEILRDIGFQYLSIDAELNDPKGLVKKILAQFTRFRQWENGLKVAKTGDIVVFQYPVRNHTLFISHIVKKLFKRNIKTICIIHDLELLRLSLGNSVPVLTKFRLKYEEISSLKLFSTIIVHNEKMKQVINERYGIDNDRMICLGLFDYLCEMNEEENRISKDKPIVIAGNLDARKSGYISKLPKNLEFNLYGANYTQNGCKNIHYKGMLPPERLPAALEGSFGLVWDGPSSKSCIGTFGEYLKINNPHKCSLYIASNVPVIIWKEAALAEFVVENNVGFCVGSLSEIEEKIQTISVEEYKLILENVNRIGKRLRSGYYTLRAINDEIHLEKK